MTKNLLNLMSKEEREKAISRATRRLQRKGDNKTKVSPEMYITAEFGYYFGWQAIQAIRNNEITLEEAHALLEGARKVYYSKLIEQSHSSLIANQSTYSKTPSDTFRSGIKSFEERAKVDE